MPRANPITAPTALAAPTGICLLPQPGGFEGLGLIDKPLTVNDLAVRQSPHLPEGEGPSDTAPTSLPANRHARHYRITSVDQGLDLQVGVDELLVQPGDEVFVSLRPTVDADTSRNDSCCDVLTVGGKVRDNRVEFPRSYAS